MFKKKLELTFLGVIIIAISFLSYNYYNSYTFKNNDIPESYKERISDKEREVLQHMQNNYGFTFKVPLIVTDKFKDRLYGLTSYKNGEIKIYLKKSNAREYGLYS